jgi:hypothetical protein
VEPFAARMGAWGLGVLRFGKTCHSQRRRRRSAGRHVGRPRHRKRVERLWFSLSSRLLPVGKAGLHRHWVLRCPGRGAMIFTL